jgi:hypothetical protein
MKTKGNETNGVNFIFGHTVPPRQETQNCVAIAELRKGRRIYAIVGSSHAGYLLQRKSNTARTGPFKIYETEDEGSLGQVVLTEETQRPWDAMDGTEEYWWEMLTEYMKDTDTEPSQVSSKLSNHIQLHDGKSGGVI